MGIWESVVCMHLRRRRRCDVRVVPRIRLIGFGLKSAAMAVALILMLELGQFKLKNALI